MPTVKYASIHEAVRHGDVLGLQALVQHGAGLDDVDPKFKFTALHWAAHHGALECLHWLLWHGADTNIVTSEGWTPVHTAAIRGQNLCLQALAANGFDMNLKDFRGKTAAHLAAAHGNSATLQSVLRKGIEIDATDNLGWSAAHTAAYHGRLACLQLLVKWGARLDTVDIEGNTATHMAASEGHVACLKFLICSAPNLELSLVARNDQGETPIDAAERFMKNKCVDYLKAVEYDLKHPETADNVGCPAHVAASKGDLPYLKMLVQTGVVSLNELDNTGSTPAHKACGNGQIQVLRWLVEQGADMEILNRASETPRDVASRFGNLGCLKILGWVSDAEPELEDENRLEMIPEQSQTIVDAKARSLHKVEELMRHLEIAKSNYRQLGGELAEDIKRREQEGESARKIQELKELLEIERLRREDLEADGDKLRAKIYLLTTQLEEANNRNPPPSPPKVVSPAVDEKPPRNVKSTRKKKVKRVARPAKILYENPDGSRIPIEEFNARPSTFTSPRQSKTRKHASSKTGSESSPHHSSVSAISSLKSADSSSKSTSPTQVSDRASLSSDSDVN